MAARTGHIPFVLTARYHGTGHSPVRRALHVPYRVVGTRVVRSAYPVICVSDVERALLCEHFGAQLVTRVVPNGVEVEAIRAAQPFERPQDRKLIVVAGRLEAYKQVENVVAAMPHLPREYELIIIGDGPARDSILQSARNLQLDARVQVAGYVPTETLRRRLRTADVFVSLSQHEAFGITLMEALVAGARVVASDIPAHREVASYIPHAPVTFIRVDCSAGELAAAVQSAVEQPRADNDIARVPTWEDTVQGTLSAYELALKKGPTAAPLGQHAAVEAEPL